MEKQEVKLLKSDVWATLLIGIAAFLLSMIVIKNLEIKIPIWIGALIFIPLCVLGIYIGYFLGKKIPVLFQFTKFGETGGLNWLVDFGVLNLLIMITGISVGIFYSIFKAISFIVSVINSYFWNKHWVFKKGHSKNPTGEFTKFSIVSIIGLLVNVGISSLIVYLSLSNPFGLTSKIWANIGAAAGSLIAMMWNFLGYKVLVFKK